MLTIAGTHRITFEFGFGKINNQNNFSQLFTINKYIIVIFKDDWTSNSDTSFGPTRAQPIRLDISSVQVSILL